MPLGLYSRLAVYAAILAAFLGLEWWVYSKGEDAVQAKWDAQKAELQAVHAAEVERLQNNNRQVEVRYLPKIQYVQGVTKTVVKEVPRYVTQIDDSRCVIPAGFVSLLNAAAEGRVPEAGGASGADAASPDTGPVPRESHAE